MRTIIRLNDLFRSTKRLAHESGQLLTKLIEDALRHTLGWHTAKPARKSVNNDRRTHGVRYSITLVIGVLVPLGELQKNHFLALIINVVQQAVGTDAKAVLCGELRHDELSRKLF